MVIKITSGWAGCEHICIKKKQQQTSYIPFLLNVFVLSCVRPFFPLFKPDLYLIQQEVNSSF